MKILKIISQYRRDFVALFGCEHCHASEQHSGYDDHYFHNEVIPKMKCRICNKTSDSGYVPMTPKYNASDII